ncbi:response regulator [Gemmatimonas sp.]|jgi:two-component system cell cycle sensor histidine kinase/response regulator CckA|uniref:response regulator n=1 Tax=Gemmatimonas sp. TaxID=1962908 RepID=UPI0037BEE4EB
MSPEPNALRILLVDDEPAVARAVSRLLVSLGNEVTVEHDPQMAEERLRRDPHAFDMLFTDQTMPGMTGDALARHALAIRPELIVVLCSGYSEHYQLDDAARDGVRAFVTKPIDRTALRDLLASLA